MALALASAAALPALAFAVPASAAPSTPAAHQAPASTSDWYVQNTGNGLYDANGGTYGDDFVTNSQHVTGIGAAYGCQSNFCFHGTPNGNCMTWDSGSNLIDDNTSCQSLERQRWWEDNIGGGLVVWVNDYADQVDSCTGGYVPAMTANGLNRPVGVNCTNDGVPGVNQEWHN